MKIGREIKREGKKRIWRERESERRKIKEKWYCGGKNVSAGFLKKKACCYSDGVDRGRESGGFSWFSLQ